MGKRVRSRRRGRGTGVYLAPSHNYEIEIKHPSIEEGLGEVLEIKNDVSHTSPIAVVKLNDKKYDMIAHSGMYVGQKIAVGTHAPIKNGNILPLGYIPDGTLIYNIEIRPNDGGKFVRAAGTYAQIVSHGERVMVLLPSGQMRAFDPRCRAVIGEPAGSGRPEKPFIKAGNKIHAYQNKAKRPYTVRGVAMNALNHPHGGGNHQHVGRPSTVSKNAPPGRKVGRFGPVRKRLKRR